MISIDWFVLVFADCKTELRDNITEATGLDLSGLDVDFFSLVNGI